MTINVILQAEAVNRVLGLTTNLVVATNTSGMVGRIFCQSTSSAVAILDSTSTTSSTGNTIWSGTMTTGQLIQLNWPYLSGLAILPGNGTINVDWN
jgi:hypothetical protein